MAMEAAMAAARRGRGGGGVVERVVLEDGMLLPIIIND